ncbi:hypothetical protein AUR64_12715 [Haloprofundus marisrubri]|uniref:Uncharacterized protein n=1 Tax=Haloprofundus marisrubri TaxID=1514971 RepID=A0A0W1R9V1_9EURY|nr:hypothetical protein [Haloprofundus marisrubri]KTG10420.1 hypothetical protein AUR64_12715 [Haloprofundus marisrubri]
MRWRTHLTKRNVIGALVLSVVLLGSGFGYVAPAISDLGDALTGANTPADAVDDSDVVEETGSTDPGEASNEDADDASDSVGEASGESDRGDDSTSSDETANTESESGDANDVGSDATDESNRSDRGRNTDRDRDRDGRDESDDPGLVVTGETNADAA